MIFALENRHSLPWDIPILSHFDIKFNGPAWASYAIAILVYWSVLATEAEDHATMVSDQLRC